MKSYGRAPTFLLRTGYEQKSAPQIELVPPGTCVCSLTAASNEADEAPAASACCDAASERDLVTAAA